MVLGERLRGLSIGLELDSAGLNRSISEVRRSFRTLNSSIQTNFNNLRYGEKSVANYERNIESLNKDILTQRKNLEALKRQYDENRRTLGDNHRETQKLATEYNKQADNLNRLERQLENATEDLRKMREEQRLAESGWGKASHNLEQFSGKMTTLGEGMTNFGRNMTTRVTMPIAGVGTAAIVTGMQFEESMSKVQAMTGATNEEIAGLEEMAKELGETTRFSASEAADAMAFLGMAGYDTNQILDSMPGLLDLAAAGQLDLGRAADITTNVMAGFNIEAEHTQEVADILAEAATSANTSVEQMGSAMSYVAPVAESAGWSIQETAAAIGVLSDNGIQGERAGTALRSMIASLQNPVGATAEVIEELGLSVEDVNPTMNSLSEILETLEEAGMDSSQAIELVGQEAGPGLSVLLSKGSKGIEDFTEQLENSEGAASRVASTMSDNTKGTMREFTSALEGVGIAVSEHILPPLTDLIKKGTDLVRKFGELDEQTQKTILVAGGLAAAVGPVALAVGGLFRGVGMLTGGLSKAMREIGRFTLRTKRAQAPIDNLSRSTGRVNENVGLVAHSFSMFGGRVSDAGKQAGGASESFDNLSQKTKNVNEQSRRTGRSVGGLTSVFGTVGDSAGKLGGSVGSAAQKIGGIRGVARLAGRAIGALAGPMGLVASFAIPELISGGINLVNHLREESIPAVDDFGDEVSDATTQAVLSYMNLNDQATAQLNELLWSQQEITPEIAENLVGTFSTMGEQIKTSLEEDFNASYQALSTFFADSKTLSEEESQEILDNMKLKQEEQRKAVAENEARIKEILQLASEEKRTLTDAERREINKIQQEMMKTAVQTMSDGEVEQIAIMERLRQQSGNITARQAAETVQNSLKAKKGSIQEANEKYEEVVRWAVRERDETGSITADQADKIIKEARKQRDESISAAEEMHENVVDQAKKQAKGQVMNIDWATGEVLTKWDKFVIGVADAVNAVTDGVNNVLEFVGLDPIPEWKPKGYSNYRKHSILRNYADGTDGHPGGPAIVGEEGPELAYIPNKGISLLGLRGPELHPNFPMGAAVLPNKETEKVLKFSGVPGYQDGIGDFWGYIVEGPKKLMQKIWEKFPIPKINVGGRLKELADGIVNYLKEKTTNYIKDKLDGLFSVTDVPGSGVQRWAGVATTALKMTGQYSPANLNLLLYQMQTESGGNPRAINLWDINAKRGTPSKGLMQVIDPTFNAYKMPGFDDIWNPLHNILASIRYTLARYGSLARGWRGVGYATGGLVQNPGLYWLAEEGYPEWVIPTAPHRRTDAMKLLALAAKSIQGNKRPKQLPNVGNTNGNDRYDEVIDKLTQQVQLLTELVVSNRQIANKPVLTEGDIARAYNRYDAVEASKQRIFRGRGGI